MLIYNTCTNPLAGVVLLDSINMDPAAGKVTEKDVAAVEMLGGRVPVNRR